MAYNADAMIILCLFLESSSWGFHCILYILAVSALVTAKQTCGRRAFWGTLTIATLLWLVGTLDMAISFYISYGQVGLKEFLLTGILTDSELNPYIQSTIGDAYLIYRLYVVYLYNWQICVFPAMLWVSQLGCLGVIAKVNYQYVDFAVDIAQPAITLALNIFATGAIAWKLYTVDRQSRASGACMQGGSRLTTLARIMIDSALLATALQLVWIVVWCTDDLAQMPVSALYTQVIGMSFHLIIIRVHGSRTSSNSVQNVTLPAISFLASPLGIRSNAHNSVMPMSGAINADKFANQGHYKEYAEGAHSDQGSQEGDGLDAIERGGVN